MMQLGGLVDSLATGRLLVYGSLPPEGRDLDLLVPPDEEERLAVALAEEGFAQHGIEWVRFQGCSVEALDLVPVASLSLPSTEEQALFQEARPLDGLSHLAWPAPHHVLLLIARSHGERGLTASRRRRLERAEAEDPDAWARARESADAWGAGSALDELEAAYRVGGAPASLPTPVASAPSGGRIRDLRWRLRTLRWAPVIAFSGVDGSGKSSQAEALRDTLTQLGFDVTIEWTRLEWTTLWEGASTLDRFARPIKRVMRLLTRTPVDAPRTVDYGKRPADPASKLRERSYLITHVWALLVALAHTAAQRRAVQASLREGKIVICDRYTLDSAVHLLDRYGPNRRFGPQIWLMHMLSPRPIRAYLVDVPAPVALERKADHFDLHELWRQAELYRRVAARLGVRMLDGQRTREELCQELAHDVWSELRPTVVP